MATATKKAATKKAATKKASVKKVVKAPAKKAVKAATKKAPPKAAVKVTKVQQATDILTKALKKNKAITRKEVIAIIVKEMKCSPARAAGHYAAAKSRI